MDLQGLKLRRFRVWASRGVLQSCYGGTCTNKHIRQANQAISAEVSYLTQTVQSEYPPVIPKQTSEGQKLRPTGPFLSQDCLQSRGVPTMSYSVAKDFVHRSEVMLP